jgi:hypothetical protein
MRFEPGVGYDDVLELKESSWSLKKAIHFALQRLARAERLERGEIRAQNDPDTLAAAREEFFKLRDYAVSAFDKRSKQQPSRRPNFLCVIPGKFSLFPTLAHQVYIEMEIRGLFQGLKDGPHTPGSKTDQELDAMVAPPHAEDVLSKLERWSSRPRQLPAPVQDRPCG